MDWNDTLYDDEYSAFLRSPEWRALRKEVFARDGGMCVMCKSKENLRAHHISYADRLNPDYLVTLCDKCHEQVHRYTKNFKTALRHDGSELNQGVNMVNSAVTRLIDQYIYARGAEFNPNGDIHFFTGPRDKQVNINRFIDKLITLDPYAEDYRDARSFWINPHGRAAWTRYNDIRLKRQGWEEIK